MWSKLRVILWKNCIIRKRHWFLTFAEILIPILLFSLVAYGRSKISGMNKVNITEPTYHQLSPEQDIYAHLDVDEDFKLWYSPNTDFTEQIIKRVEARLQIAEDAVREFSSKKELLKHFHNNSDSFIAVVNFNGDNQNHLDYDLSIYDKYVNWNTDELYNWMLIAEDASSSKYLYKGFAALQVAIDMSFMELSLNKPVTNIAFSIEEFPEPPHTVDSGLNQLFLHFLPLITIVSFIFLCPAVVKRVAEEKQSGTKEFMKMVGLKSWMIWFGWLVHALITNLFSIMVIIVLMKIPFWGVPYTPIEYSDGTVLFVLLFLYCMAAVTSCFLIASIINAPTIAATMGIFLWIFSYFVLLYVINLHDNLPWTTRIAFALFPNMALYYGYSSISVFEMREIGIQWYNLFQPETGGEDDITMGTVFIMLICDILIFMMLTLYVENIKPGEYGIAKPIAFPLTNLKNFVKKSSTKRTDEDLLLLQLDAEKGKIPCIEIQNLHKNFGNHVAVDHLSMEIYKNQITVLLGQNGAGKTTTMNILTGMINATSGHILVNEKDISIHTDEVRNLMGLCPQHNLLFPDLTVKEHLMFFAKLKNSPNPRGECKEMLETLGILEKRNDMATTLSGGMKRKLCLGMALIGNSPILILDEPTSGMDPESRRKVWDLLLKYRKTRTILITTHFMEEADVLGDQIAIMADGWLQCHGTPLQLKIQYNTGYHLSLMLNSKYHLGMITSKVKEHIPGAKLIRETDDTVVYLLPTNQDIYDTRYREIFDTLEDNKQMWGIITIGLNTTTLNDVFLKAKDEIDGKSENQIDPRSSKGITQSKLRGISRLSNIICSLWIKRVAFLRKKYYWFIPAMIVTFCILSLSLWLTMTNDNYYRGAEPPLNLTLEDYGKTLVYYGGPESSNTTVASLRKFYHDIVLRAHSNPTLEQLVSEAIIEKGIVNIAFYKKHMVVAAEFIEGIDTNEIVVNSMYSAHSLHGLPISINLAMNALAKALLNSTFEITIRNAPLTPIYSDVAPSELSLVNVMSVWLILIPFGMLFFMSNFIIFPNTEISTNFMQIQIMAGITTHLYWCSNLVFDIVLSLPQFVLLVFPMVLINLLGSNSTAFQLAEILTIIAMFFSYTVASLPFTYLLSYKKTITGGIALLFMFGIFLGIIPTIFVAAMEFSSQDYYTQIANTLKHVFLIISPQFALSYMGVQFSKKYVENFNWKYMDPIKRNHICNTDPNPCCFGTATTLCHNYQDYFLNKDSGLLLIIFEMLLPCGLYFIILLLLRKSFLMKLTHFLKYYRSPPNLHNRKERRKETITKCKNDEALLVNNLTKSFGANNTAVDKLKFKLKKNKCLGLLGVNGAGKSTTFRMLTKELFFDEGEVVLTDGKDVPIKAPEYCEKIGYCPQENCLNYFLTGEELLHSMARLKGYSKQEADQITNLLLMYFELKKYANIPSSHYSGGNKRKLCASIAFLGNPKIIMLDEPTSGVDPISRRNFWNILSSFKNTGDTSVLLCSHSMEECENLCDEIAIMKKGQIKAQGSLLALKNKHQKGFKIKIKLKSGIDDSSSIKERIATYLNATLLEEYAETIEFKVDGINKLSQLFETLQIIKNESKGKIEDYVVNQMSLEDVFLSVAGENDGSLS